MSNSYKYPYRYMVRESTILLITSGSLSWYWMLLIILLRSSIPCVLMHLVCRCVQIVKTYVMMALLACTSVTESWGYYHHCCISVGRGSGQCHVCLREHTYLEGRYCNDATWPQHLYQQWWRRAVWCSEESQKCWSCHCSELYSTNVFRWKTLMNG